MSNEQSSPSPEESSGKKLLLCLDGLPVSEGYVNAAVAADRHVIDQSVEGVEAEFGELLRQFFKGTEIQA